jgi:hypothetical protein
MSGARATTMKTRTTRPQRNHPTQSRKRTTPSQQNKYSTIQTIRLVGSCRLMRRPCCPPGDFRLGFKPQCYALSQRWQCGSATSAQQCPLLPAKRCPSAPSTAADLALTHHHGSRHLSGDASATASSRASQNLLSTHILRKNRSFPEKDQWRQARARAWVSGTN